MIEFIIAHVSKFDRIEQVFELIFGVIGLFIIPLFIAVLNANYKEQQEENSNEN